MKLHLTLIGLLLSLGLNALTYKEVSLDSNSSLILGFDDRGLLTEETLKGVLTGTSKEPETYTTQYAYSNDDAHHLIKRSEGNGITTDFLYNDTGHATEVIINGPEEEPYKKRLVFYPSLNQPEMLIEYFYDIQTGEEKIVKRVENVYSEDAKLIYQNFFNSADASETEILHQYDALGNRISAFDQEGNGVEKIFDPNGNCLSQTQYQHYERSNESFFTYDEDNKPILSEKNVGNGKLIPTLQEFNEKNQCVADIGPTGNRIEYVYNDQGQIEEILYPCVLDCDDYYYQPTQKWTYDKLGRVTTYTDLRGESIHIQYTSRNQVLQMTYADGSYERFEYRLDGTPVSKIQKNVTLPPQHTKTPETFDELQHVAVISDSLGQSVLQHTGLDNENNTTTMTLDALGRIAHIQKRNCYGEITLDQECRYDGAGNKTCERQLFRTPDGEEQTLITRWEYGPRGRLSRVFEAYGLPEQKITNYQYDSDGRLTTVVKPDGTELRYDYNNSHLVSRIWSSDGSIDYHLTYNGEDLIGCEDTAIKQSGTRGYTANHQLTEEMLGNGLSVSALYDSTGKRSSFRLPDGSGFSYEWNGDTLKSIHRIDKEGNVLYSYHYSEGRTQDQLINQQGTLTYSVNKEGRCLEIVSPYWVESIPEESYDKDGKLHCSIESSTKETNTHRFRYDDRSRLVEDNETEYQYDTLSNRYSKPNTTYNLLCQLVQEGETSYQYDANGNLTASISPKGQTTYQYDALNRLTDVTCENTRYHYTYDYHNRRLSKTVYQNGASIKTEHYIYDGYNEIGSVDESGEIVELRMLGPGLGAEIGAAVAVEMKGKAYAPIHDHRGSVVCLARNQKTVETYHYNAFGEESIHSKKQFTGNPWRFSSKRVDPETGFVYFGKRYYNPTTGRWTTQDPLGFIEGANRYQFVGSNPMTEIDLYGSFSVQASWDCIYDYCDYLYNKSYDIISSTDSYIQENLSFETYIKPTIDNIAENILGEAMLVILGYYIDDAGVGICGKGELNDKVRVTIINGILNIRSWAEGNAELISSTHSDINVHYIFRPTRGWTQDLVKATFVKFGYASEEARLLARTWKQLIQEMGGTSEGGLIVHYAHSIGGADTAIARQFLTPEEQKMIRVISLGSPLMISHEGFHSVINYMSLRDGIFILAPFSHFSTLFSYDHNVIYLDSYWVIPGLDHLLHGGTYQTLIETLGQEFIEEFVEPKKDEKPQS